MYWSGIGVIPQVVQPVVVPFTISSFPHCAANHHHVGTCTGPVKLKQDSLQSDT